MYKVNEEKIIKEWEERRTPYAVVPWTDSINSTPIQDLRSWQTSLANFCGLYGNTIEFSNETFLFLSKTKEFYEVKISKPYDLKKYLFDIDTQIIINQDLKDGLVVVRSKGKEKYSDLEATVF